jgi:hypothetical protein
MRCLFCKRSKYVSQATKALVDGSCLFLSVTFGSGFGQPLATGQIAQIKSAFNDNAFTGVFSS